MMIDKEVFDYASQLIDTIVTNHATCEVVWFGDFTVDRRQWILDLPKCVHNEELQTYSQ